MNRNYIYINRLDMFCCNHLGNKFSKRQERSCVAENKTSCYATWIQRRNS